jgi:hypothetical protein
LTWDWVTVAVHEIPAVVSDLTIAISNISTAGAFDVAVKISKGSVAVISSSTTDKLRRAADIKGLLIILPLAVRSISN